MMTSAGSGTPSFLDAVEYGVGTWAWGDRLFWGFGQSYNEEDIRSAFDISVASGATLFDTAEVYAQGGSELRLGKFLKTTDRLIHVATKFMPYPWRFTRRSVLAALEKSLKRLDVSEVALYQIHHPGPPFRLETWMEAMAEAVQRGLTRSIGVSNFSLAQMQEAYDALTRLGMILAANQVEYHLLNRKIEQDGLLQRSRELGVKVIAYSPLGSGVLSGKYSAENPPPGFRSKRYSRQMMTRIVPLINELRKIGLVHAGKTPAQVAINWTVCKGTIPIPGAKNARQASENAGAVGWRLTDEEVARLDSISDRVTAEK